MKNRLFVFAILVSLLAGGCSLFAWKEFKSTKGQFSLTLPGTPKEQTETINTQAGDIDLHLFLLEKSDIAYMVGYSDYPEDLLKVAKPQQILDGARDGAVSNVKGELLQEKTATLKGHKGREIKIKTEKGIIRARLFLVGSRLYQLMVITGKEKALSKNIEKSFDSFKILEK